MKNIITIAFLSLLFTSCASKGNSEIEVSFNEPYGFIKLIATHVIDTIKVKANTLFINSMPNVRNTGKSVQILNDSICYIKFNMIVPDMVNFEIDRNDTFTTYLIPGDTLEINLSQESLNKSTIKTSYRVKNEIFDYCQAKFKKLGYYKILDGPGRKKWLLKLCTSEEQYNSLLKEVDSVEKVNLTFLEQNTKRLPDWFVKVEKYNIKYSSQHFKLLFYQSLTTNSKKENLELNEPIYTPDAILSADYYSYILNFFIYGRYLRNLSDLKEYFSKIYPQIDSTLKGSIKDIFMTSYFARLYEGCRSLKDFDDVETFLSNSTYNLSSDKLAYIQKEKEYIKNKLLNLVSLKEGDVAPEFNLSGIDGKNYRLSELRGKIIYLHFWATWCAPCLNEMPVLNSFISNSDKTKIIVINVCLDNEPTKWKSIINDKGLQGINLICNENQKNELNSRYKISALPHYTLIDKMGLIIKNNCDRPSKIQDYLIPFLTVK
jgi:thiol-disulfide isomerase/thioredoxin